MITSAVNINSTPMGPYVGILKGLNRRERQIVIEYLQQAPVFEKEEMVSEKDDIEALVRAKFNVEESPETIWFKNHPIVLTADELDDERTQFILR